jgi:hypothetical protein
MTGAKRHQFQRRMWTLAFGHHEDRTPTHGSAETREAAMAAFAKSWRRGISRIQFLGRVLINRDCSAIAGCRKRCVRIVSDAQAIFFRRRHQPRRPPPAKINANRPVAITPSNCE